MDSKHNLVPIEELELTTDLTLVDIAKVNDFKEAGMPGLAALGEAQVTRIMDLYLSGKTYTQISSALNVKRVLVMYIAQRFDWFVVRRDFFNEMESSIKQRLLEEKIRNQDFLLQLTHFYQSKLGKQVNKFLKTGNEADAEIDPKVVAQYFKAVEILNKFDSAPKAAAASAIGLNLGDGMSIKKISETEVEITPRAQVQKEMLKRFADSRRNLQTNPSEEAKALAEKEEKTEDESE